MTKRSLWTIFLIAVLAISLILQISSVNAYDLPTYLQVTAEPNPVGVGQTVYISLFFTKPIPTGTDFSQVYKDLTVNLVKPDGTNQTFGPYTGDTTGGVGGIEYTPSAAGNYTVQAIYPGQTLISGDKALPDVSDAITFTVQEEPISGFNVAALPSEYWSRPIYATNYAWSQLGGNWWGLGKPSFADTGGYDATGNNFNTYTQAPTSSHIMWVKQSSLGGQVGGPISGDQESQYSSTSVAYRYFEPIILNGVLYYKVYSNIPTYNLQTSQTIMSYNTPETPGWNAVDLRTGELLWHKDTIDILCFAFCLQYHTIQEYGTQAWLVGSYNASLWQMFDPVTGYWIANITNVPSTTAAGLVEDKDDNSQGAVYIYAISSGKLTLWNSTKMLADAAVDRDPAGNLRCIRPNGNINYTLGYQWSVPINTTYNGNPVSMSVAARTFDGILLRSAPTLSTQISAGWAVEAAYDARTGDKLWGPINRTIPLYGDMALLAAGEGYYVTHNKDTNEAYGFNIKTGNQVWGPVKLEGSALSTLSRGGAIAYGNCYIWDFGGYVNAIDLKTGTVAWTYEPRQAGYNTPYGIYPFWHFGSHSIADGMLFLSESRMYDPPLFSDAHKIVLNCTDGSLAWKALGFYGREPSAIADGYMVAFNSYDAQIYVYGKGPTKTTAQVTDDTIKSGDSVLITGTVYDVASGTRDSDRSARFPNGVAAVSDASQEAWMAYVYMQQEKPTNATGVPVEVYVVDANGNYRIIGTTTTDTNGFYSLNWTPDISGKYTVYAMFGGSESYYASQASTAFMVDEVAPPPTVEPVQPESVADQYFLPAVLAIILAIAIGFAITILVLRKRP